MGLSKLEEITQISYSDFIEDDKTISTVTRKLEIIGEATKKIPQKEDIKI